jgi:predicted Zn finger-like uncharacterized protein
MFTVCPKCALTLVVTAADLRVAQGYVRCGRCSNVFNALARLSEDRQSAAAAAAAQGPSSDPPAPQPQAVAEELPPQEQAEGPPDTDDDAIPETALEFNPDATDVTKVFVEPPPNPSWSAATGTFKAIVLKTEEASHAELEQKIHPPGPSDAGTQFDLEMDAAELLSASGRFRANTDTPAGTAAGQIDVTSAIEPLSGLRPASPAPAPVTGKSQPKSSPPLRSAPQPKAPAESRTAPRPTARAVPTRTPFDDIADEQATLARTRASSADSGRERTHAESPFSAAWSAGTGALLILLAAQVVHHYRHDLAADPRLNKPLTALYAALGVSLMPRWNLGAYEVRQLGASEDAASSGRITVRASVKNGANQAQPLPLLRVTLQDRFGNRIAARDVPPQSYLPRAIPASSFLSSGQRIDAEMAFVDPGSSAVGFEVDACLPAPGGAIACANDSGSR